MATLPPQVLLPLLHPSMLLHVLPQIVVPHLLCPICECTLNPQVLLMGFFVCLNSNLFSIFVKTPLQMLLIYIYLELWNAQIAFSHGTTFFPHTLKMMVNVTTTSLPTTNCPNILLMLW
jgi:hypothetical protein